ncbi:unnamed protein product [Rotaria socialis]|uniref:Uncharacterized protein n=1 Tax=Rotaria socialis TaxID=392032 RepID=A0A818DWL7_9BILA|nr:unnamed protein product [Rotaria socialis]
MLVKSSMLSQFTNDHQQQQQQQTPTSPSLQRNSSRIQTKSTAFNNNANYDGIEQDSPIRDAEAETLNTGTRDHWSIVMKSDRIGLQTNGNGPVADWTVFQIVLTLMKYFWIKESEIQDAENWYLNCTRFLVALKNRVTKWRNRNR